MEEGCSGEKNGRDGGDTRVLAERCECGDEKIRGGVERSSGRGYRMGVMAAMGAGDLTEGEEKGTKSVFDMKFGMWRGSNEGRLTLTGGAERDRCGEGEECEGHGDKLL